MEKVKKIMLYVWERDDRELKGAGKRREEKKREERKGEDMEYLIIRYFYNNLCV
jgi:hypothetical protein